MVQSRPPKSHDIVLIGHTRQKIRLFYVGAATLYLFRALQPQGQLSSRALRVGIMSVDRRAGNSRAEFGIISRFKHDLDLPT
jgi:hypothetical protein